jgi:hypothetical protein
LLIFCGVWKGILESGAYHVWKGRGPRPSGLSTILSDV